MSLDANKKLLFEHQKAEKLAAELVRANKKLLFEHEEKEKLAAELIIAREFRIAAIIFESQEGMLVTDANKHILRVNKAFPTFNLEVHHIFHYRFQKVSCNLGTFLVLSLVCFLSLLFAYERLKQSQFL